MDGARKMIMRDDVTWLLYLIIFAPLETDVLFASAANQLTRYF